MYSNPKSNSTRTALLLKGITHQLIKLSVKVSIGALINKSVLELLGIIDSFKTSFNPSAKGCNNPKKPTTFGPFLLCIDAITLRSTKVKYATDINKGTINSKNFTTKYKNSTIFI